MVFGIAVVPSLNSQPFFHDLFTNYKILSVNNHEMHFLALTLQSFIMVHFT